MTWVMAWAMAWLGGAFPLALFVWAKERPRRSPEWIAFALIVAFWPLFLLFADYLSRRDEA